METAIGTLRSETGKDYQVQVDSERNSLIIDGVAFSGEGMGWIIDPRPEMWLHFERFADNVMVRASRAPAAVPSTTADAPSGYTVIFNGKMTDIEADSFTFQATGFVTFYRRGKQVALYPLHETTRIIERK